MAFAPGCHATVETASQIDFTGLGEGDADLFLSGVCHRHLPLRDHGSILRAYFCARNF